MLLRTWESLKAMELPYQSMINPPRTSDITATMVTHLPFSSVLHLLYSA